MEAANLCVVNADSFQNLLVAQPFCGKLNSILCFADSEDSSTIINNKCISYFTKFTFYYFFNFIRF